MKLLKNKLRKWLFPDEDSMVVQYIYLARGEFVVQAGDRTALDYEVRYKGKIIKDVTTLVRTQK